MKIEFVDNSVVTAAGVLGAQFANCRRAFLASAFVTERGLLELFPRIKQVAAGANIRLVTGVYDFFNDPKTFRYLLRLSSEYRTFSARVAENPHFHEKLYVFERENSVTALIGSSNLTGDGLSSLGEFNAVLHCKRDSATGRRLIRHVEQLWDQGAITLDDGWIDHYERIRPPRERHHMPSFRKLFPKAIASRPDQKVPSRLWLDVVTEFFHEGTARVVNAETGWSKAGYEYHSSVTATRMRKNDFICLFDYRGGRATYRLYRVVDSRNDLQTPDGKHFVAYVPARRFQTTRLTENRRAILKRLGVLLTKRKTRRRVVGPADWEKIEAITLRSNRR